jgi:Lar family restriction alleviation protein
MSEELKPCPFCGGEAGVGPLHTTGGFRPFHVSCYVCGVEYQHAETEAAAIAAWNRRTPTVPDDRSEAHRLLDALIDMDVTGGGPFHTLMDQLNAAITAAQRAAILAAKEEK